MTLGYLNRMADAFIRTKKIGRSETAHVLNQFLRFIETNQPTKKNGWHNNITSTPRKLRQKWESPCL